MCSCICPLRRSQALFAKKGQQLWQPPSSAVVMMPSPSHITSPCQVHHYLLLLPSFRETEFFEVTEWVLCIDASGCPTEPSLTNLPKKTARSRVRKSNFCESEEKWRWVELQKDFKRREHGGWCQILCDWKIRTQKRWHTVGGKGGGVRYLNDAGDVRIWGWPFGTGK